MPQKRFFAFSPDEVLELEALVAKVLEPVLRIGANMAPGTRMEISTMEKQKSELCPAGKLYIAKVEEITFRSFGGKKIKVCNEVTVAIQQVAGETWLAAKDPNASVFWLPHIEGLPSNFLAGFLAQRLRQLVFIYNQFAHYSKNLWVEEVGCEYFFVRRP